MGRTRCDDGPRPHHYSLSDYLLTCSNERTCHREREVFSVEQRRSISASHACCVTHARKLCAWSLELVEREVANEWMGGVELPSADEAEERRCRRAGDDGGVAGLWVFEAQRVGFAVAADVHDVSAGGVHAWRRVRTMRYADGFDRDVGTQATGQGTARPGRVYAAVVHRHACTERLGRREAAAVGEVDGDDDGIAPL